MTTFVELMQAVSDDPCIDTVCGAVAPYWKEMRARVVKLQAAIDDPDGADELPMIVLEFLDGES